MVLLLESLWLVISYYLITTVMTAQLRSSFFGRYRTGWGFRVAASRQLLAFKYELKLFHRLRVLSVIILFAVLLVGFALVRFNQMVESSNGPVFGFVAKPYQQSVKSFFSIYYNEAKNQRSLDVFGTFWFFCLP